MAQYKNGREAKLGDLIVFKDLHGNTLSGLLISIDQGGAGSVAPLGTSQSVMLGETLHNEDIDFAIVAKPKAAGSI